MTLCIELSSDGLVKYYIEVQNIDSKKSEEASTRYGVYFQLMNAIMPYDGKIIELKSTEDIDLGNWDLDKLYENWICTEHYGDKYGMAWSQGLKVINNEWHFAFEENLGEIEAGEKRVSKPIYLALDTFKEWYEFRDFALRNREINKNSELDTDNKNPDYRTEESIGLEINNGNPIIKDDFPITIKRYKKANIIGNILINSKYDYIYSFNKNINKKEEDRELSFELNINKEKIEKTIKDNKESKAELLNIHIDLSSMIINRKKLVFYNSTSDGIKQNIEKVNQDKIYTISNGVIEMKAAENYGPVLYSLSYQGKEWLDQTYPAPGAKSWWNPWFGGIATYPGGLQNVSQAEAKRQFEFAALEDNYANKWQGISVEMRLEDNKDFKGLILKQYYLTLAKLPLVLLTTEIIQNTGKYYKNKGFYTDIYLKGAEELKERFLSYRRKDGEFIKYRAGYNAYDINVGKTALFGTENDNSKLQLFQSGYHSCWGFMNLDVFSLRVENYLSIKDGSKLFTPPVFLMFTDDFYQERYLEGLKNVRF
ncbi:MAG: hypothetical protein ACOCZT_01655 [Halanaerobiales bacterium]